MLASNRVELWAGLECTVNRVGQEFYDQLEVSGHAHRESDIEAFASLGIKRIRYPVLWERIEKNPGEYDWSWTDKRLKLLQALGINPIAGLLHHGSGPRYTDLLDLSFPEKLSYFAGKVAERYPWLDAYTPVNEPLTTARFSALYGIWYPHAKDARSFCRALVNQCRGVVMSMSAIRKTNPSACLIQTEDLAKIHSTKTLKYQADFENERRWLSWDIICGKVGRHHLLWKFLIENGISEKELFWFKENNCPPDIIGINYYVTSERFLDEKTERYPVHTHGGNGQIAYADVEAVRVLEDGLTGPEKLIEEVWSRYRRPIAITEAHIGCTREAQLRWLEEIWQAASSAKKKNIDVRAVTAWALLGAYDWCSLLTRKEGLYESGVFDLRSPRPRRTALAKFITGINSGVRPTHPVLDSPGWWHEPERIIYQPYKKTHDLVAGYQYQSTSKPSYRPLVITGKGGLLAGALARVCEERKIRYILLSRKELDIADMNTGSKILRTISPWAIINAAGYTRVNEAEQNFKKCYRDNTLGPKNLAMFCNDQKIGLVTFSSHLVFNGHISRPYVERDSVEPLSIYGRCKAQAEKEVLSIMPDAIIIRSGTFFGPWDTRNFVTTAIKTTRETNTFKAAVDTIVSPSYLPDLINTALDLLIDGERGIWHLSNGEALSWYDLAKRAIEVTRPALSTYLEGCSIEALNHSAPRPAYSALSSEKAVLLPNLDNALHRFAADSMHLCNA
jgi:dTDP-4-dehydrorhamnose reductase